MNVQDVRTLLAERLKAFRVSAGLTTVEVGHAIGKSDKTVSGWEHGRGQPDADLLFALCRLYKITDISKFFPESSPSPDSHFDPDEVELLACYRSVNEAGKKHIMKTARFCADDPEYQDVII